MASVLLLLILVTFSVQENEVSGRKVKERWSGVSSNYTIKVLFPSTQRGAINNSPSVVFEGMDTLFAPFKGWTVSEQMGMKLGERYPNGSWDGLIGSAVSGRADFVMQFVNPNIFDAGHDIPVTLGPIALDGSLAIISAAKEEPKFYTTLLGFFRDAVSLEFYTYCLIWTLIFISTHTIIVIFLWKRKPKRMRASARNACAGKISYPKAVILNLINCLWIVTEIFVLTDSSATPKVKIRKTKSLTVLTSAVIIAVYYALDIVLWSMLSGELAVETPPKHIDSISDLIKARELTPTILTDFGAFSSLATSTNAKERALYDHILKYPAKDSRVSFNGDGSTSTRDIYKMIKEVNDSKIAVIERVFSFSFVPLICFHQPVLTGCVGGGCNKRG